MSQESYFKPPKRLSALRAKANLSQSEVATKLKTTQQTIARWESGEVAVPASKLVELSQIYKCSVDDLLGATHGRLRPRGMSVIGDGYTADLGLRLPSDERCYYWEINGRQWDAVTSGLESYEYDQGEWVSVPTLAQRHLLFRPAAVGRIWLRDEGADFPHEDTVPGTAWAANRYSSHDAADLLKLVEHYKRNDEEDERADEEEPGFDIPRIAAGLYETLCLEDLSPSERLAEHLKSVARQERERAEYERRKENNETPALEEASREDEKRVEENVERVDFDELYEKLLITRIHLTSGSIMRLPIEAVHALRLLESLERSDSKIINFQITGGDGYVFFNANDIALIDFPILLLVEAQEELEEGRVDEDDDDYDDEEDEIVVEAAKKKTKAQATPVKKKRGRTSKKLDS